MKRDIPIVDICSLSEFKEEDILVSRFAEYLKEHHNLHLAHRHSFYHLILFTKGGGSHTIDFNSFEVKPFQIYFMVPGQVHSWEFEGEVDGYVVNFSPAFFQSFLLKQDYLESFSFFNGITDDSVINLPKDLHEGIQKLFEEIIAQAAPQNASHWDIIRVLLLQIFMKIDQSVFRNKQTSAPNYNYTLLRNFQKLIEKHYTHLKLPMEYAELLYITPNHLNALCKDQMGMQAGELIRNRILLEAKRLLVNQDLSISEIAYTLNFKDNSYFTKFFKRQAGITPEEFRRKAG